MNVKILRFAERVFASVAGLGIGSHLFNFRPELSWGWITVMFLLAAAAEYIALEMEGK
jgi:hypothetical protein